MMGMSIFINGIQHVQVLASWETQMTVNSYAQFYV